MGLGAVRFTIKIKKIKIKQIDWAINLEIHFSHRQNRLAFFSLINNLIRKIS